MNLLEQKRALKRIREAIRGNDIISDDHALELIDAVNVLIGRVNCELTDDDAELERLANLDGLRGVENEQD